MSSTRIPPSAGTDTDTAAFQGLLPAEAYHKPSFLAAEEQQVFSRHWACIGTLDDVAEPGDVCPVRLAGRDLILTHARDGIVRVFHNYCRHRGMRLVSAPCSRQARLVCPYHAWSYRLDGRLAGTPHIGGPDAHDASTLGIAVPEGLEPVRSALWHRLVFVDLSGAAQPFEAFIAPLTERWQAYDFSLLRKSEGAGLEVACNWKLAVENFVDVYHLPTVHPGLNSYSDMRDHYTVVEKHLFGEGNAKVTPDDPAVGRLPMFPDLPADKRTTLEALCLFPNLLITVTCDHLRFIIVEPDGPERCRERVEIYVVGDDALAPELAVARQTLLTRFAAFNTEDIGICETLQTSMRHSAYRDGVFSPFFDGAVRRFQQTIVDAIADTD